MKEPIIIFEGLDTDVFRTLLEAERYLEPIDAKCGNNMIFDAEGRVLEAHVVEDLRGLEKTMIVEREPEKFNKLKLKKGLTIFLRHLNYTEQSIKELNLTELVKEVVKFNSI